MILLTSTNYYTFILHLYNVKQCHQPASIYVMVSIVQAAGRGTRLLDRWHHPVPATRSATWRFGDVISEISDPRSKH